MNSAGAKLAIAVIVGSVIYALGGDLVRGLLLLTPDLVLHRFFLWQLFTYAFVATDPLGVIFAALIFWSIGQSMEGAWGGRRVLFFSVGTTALAGLLTVLLSLVWHRLGEGAFPGAWAMGSALWVAYGLYIGRGETNFWGMPVSGNTLALIGVGFVFLNGAFAGSWAGVVPEAIAIGLAFLYVRGLSMRALQVRLGTWRMQRQLKMRAKHLKLVSKERNMPSDSDRFLH